MATMTSPYPARRASDVICGMPPVSTAAAHPRTWRPAANVDREVVSFSWQSVLLLPRFQFRGPALSRQPAIITAMRELREVLSDWDAALWFALPNIGLDGASPAGCFEQNPSAVCHAAIARRHLSLA